ncbi:hypothetical protein MTO96_000597 [Rhipicephalus appendiculatus]
MFSRLLFLSTEPLEPELPRDRRLLLDAGGGGLVAKGLAMLGTGAAAVFKAPLLVSAVGCGRVLSGFGEVGLGLLELSTLKNLRGDRGGGTGSSGFGDLRFRLLPQRPKNAG